MPTKSKAQSRAMHAAAQGKSTLGIPSKVGKEYVAADKGRSLSSLPWKVKKKAK